MYVSYPMKERFFRQKEMYSWFTFDNEKVYKVNEYFFSQKSFMIGLRNKCPK